MVSGFQGGPNVPAGRSPTSHQNRNALFAKLDEPPALEMGRQQEFSDQFRDSGSWTPRRRNLLDRPTGLRQIPGRQFPCGTAGPYQCQSGQKRHGQKRQARQETDPKPLPRRGAAGPSRAFHSAWTKEHRGTKQTPLKGLRRRTRSVPVVSKAIAGHGKAGGNSVSIERFGFTANGAHLRFLALTGPQIPAQGLSLRRCPGAHASIGSCALEGRERLWRPFRVPDVLPRKARGSAQRAAPGWSLQAFQAHPKTEMRPCQWTRMKANKRRQGAHALSSAVLVPIVRPRDPPRLPTSSRHVRLQE